MLENFILIGIAYLIGSISSAVITCKLFGMQDPRTTGSKNAGATNVLRMSGGNKLPAIITLLGDVSKGVIPLLIARLLGKPDFIVAVVLLGAILGHLYPLFFKFQGGKGIATFIGGLLILAWNIGVLFILAWGITYLIRRISSLSAIVATLLTPIFAYYSTDLITTTIITVICGLIIYKHKDNITRLCKREEKQI